MEPVEEKDDRTRRDCEPAVRKVRSAEEEKERKREKKEHKRKKKERKIEKKERKREKEKRRGRSKGVEKSGSANDGQDKIQSKSGKEQKKQKKVKQEKRGRSKEADESGDGSCDQDGDSSGSESGLEHKKQKKGTQERSRSEEESGDDSDRSGSGLEADVDAEQTAWSKLSHAVKQGRADKVGQQLRTLGAIRAAALLQLGRGSNGATLLHLAMRCRPYGAIALLVQRGSNVNAVDVSGCTPAHYATSPVALRSLLTACEAAGQEVDFLCEDDEGVSVEEVIYALLHDSEHEGLHDVGGGSGGRGCDDASFRARLADEMFFEAGESSGATFLWEEEQFARDSDWFQQIADERAARLAARVRNASKVKTTDQPPKKPDIPEFCHAANTVARMKPDDPPSNV